MECKNKETIYISNLPQSTTEDDLQAIFENFGIIVSCDLDKDTNTAYIEFDNALSADRALAMDNVEMGSKQVKIVIAFTDDYIQKPVSYSLSSTKIEYSSEIQIYVGDIAYNVDDTMLQSRFSEFGTIKSARIMRSSDGKHRGYGFVTFTNKADAERAIQSMHNTIFHNRTIKCSWATKNEITSDKKPSNNKTFDEMFTETNETNTSVYVTGDNLFEEVIRPCFERFGYIKSIKAFPEKNHAFVNYECHDAAAHAILQLNGYCVGNTTFKCAWGKKGAVSDNEKRTNHSPPAAQSMVNIGDQYRATHAYAHHAIGSMDYPYSLNYPVTQHQSQPMYPIYTASHNPCHHVPHFNQYPPQFNHYHPYSTMAQHASQPMSHQFNAYQPNGSNAFPNQFPK